MTIPATEMKTPSCRPGLVHRVKDVFIKDGFNHLSAVGLDNKVRKQAKTNKYSSAYEYFYIKMHF